jgi:hypothetical protein
LAERRVISPQEANLENTINYQRIQKNLQVCVTHLNSLPETTISKQAFLISKDLFIKKSNSFYGKAMDIVKTLNLVNCNRTIPDLDSLTTNLVESCVKDTKESYQRIWRHKPENTSKLIFYTSIKEDYELETYLTTITNSNQRKRLTQLHKLMIELGRYENIPREDRICKVCQPCGEIETEHHFLTSCEAYSSLRENFLNDLESDPTNETDLNEQSLPVEIMKTTVKKPR